MINQKYNLNLIPSGVNVVVKASQYDKGARTIQFTLYNGDELFTIPAGCDVHVLGTKPDNTGYVYSCTYSGSVVSFDVEDQMTVCAGKHQAEVRITKNGEILGTANFTFSIEKAGLDDDTEISETVIPYIEQIIEDLPQIEQIATNLPEILLADDNALKSEGFAVGEQNGVPVSSDSPYYHNNAKWYKEQASEYTRQIYGIKRSLTSANSVWERTDDSVGLVANATHDGTSVFNDFDSLYPWNSIVSVNMADDGTINAIYGDVNFKFDGSNGEVMTYIPSFYYKRWQDTDYEYIQISNKLFDGASHSDGFYLGRYTTSSGAHSKSGVSSQVDTTITNFRTQAQTKGTGWQQLDWHYFLLQMLYLVEYADGNSQSKLGLGNSSTSAQITLGGCDALGMKSGCLTSDGAHAVIYRGVENPFGNIWQFVDGINIQNRVAYINYDPSTYAVDTFTGDYQAVGYTNASSNGNPNKMGYDANNPTIMFPIAVGTSIYGDYYWQNTGNRIAFVGGSWFDGANCGFFCWGLHNALSFTNSAVGSRLLKK